MREQMTSLVAVGPAPAGVGRPMTRRAFAGLAVLAGVAAAGCRGGEDHVVMTGWGKLGQDAFMEVAAARGYLGDAGVHVRLVAGGGSGPNLLALLAGRAVLVELDAPGALHELATTWRKRLTDTGSGGWKAIAAVHQRQVACITALSGNGISGLADLAGKTVGYTAGSAYVALFRRAIAPRVGLDPDSVRWHNAPPADLRKLLVAGKVDAITDRVEGEQAIRAMAGRNPVVLPFADHMPAVLGNVLVVREELLRAEPALARGLAIAYTDALSWSVDHPAEAGEVFHDRNPAYPAAAAAAETAAMKQYVRPAGGAPVGVITRADMAATIAAVSWAGLIPAGVRIIPEQVVADGYLRDPA